MTNRTLPAVFVVIPAALLLWTAVRWFRVRTATKRLFQKRFGKIIDPRETRTLVEQINRESQGPTFFALKVLQLNYRGERIRLIRGMVWYLTGASRKSIQRNNCVFVISPNNGTPFFNEHRDVFRHAFTGSQYTLFFADPQKILTELSVETEIAKAAVS